MVHMRNTIGHEIGFIVTLVLFVEMYAGMRDSQAQQPKEIPVF